MRVETTMDYGTRTLYVRHTLLHVLNVHIRIHVDFNWKVQIQLLQELLLEGKDGEQRML